MATNNAVIVDTSRSRHASLSPIPVNAVRFTDVFWQPRQAINRAKTIPGLLQLLSDTGRVANFQRAAGKVDGTYQGIFFNDSDVYKWIEAAAWDLANHPDTALAQSIDDLIAEIEPAQQADGYLNTYFMFERASERWSNFDLHEGYCAGHLFQAAVAHKRVTGSDRLLNIAVKFADHIDSVFGPPETGKKQGVDGHPEIEMGLVELGRITGEQRYINLARYFLDVRGRGLLGNAYDRYGTEYHQDHLPFRELQEITGHAVRAVYLNAGAADIYTETGDDTIAEALHRLWTSMTTRKMYVSGGLGSRYEGEAFGDPYELPNRLAYTETCAAIGSIMWCWRMFLVEREAHYVDLLEHTLYNAVLPGVSLDGDLFFYQNPLADDGRHRRAPWFRVACCPPNLARLVAQLPGYLYAVTHDSIWVNLFASSTATLQLGDDRTIGLTQTANYPWEGEVEFTVEGSGEFALHVRVPSHSKSATIQVNDEPAVAVSTGAYVEIRRTWSPGDRLRLSLTMPVRWLQAHPYVTENRGQYAIQRGPILYCAEQPDHAADVRDLKAPSIGSLSPVHEPELLGGVTVLTGAATAAAPAGWDDRLYRDAGDETAFPPPVPATMRLIPYFAWGNREPGPMRVWFPRR